jgi:acyl-coenzyme A synthetase/AMP-(fatty) acid ligase
VKESDPALIAFTSGSTGRPKGVTYTHASICHTTTNKSKMYRLDGSDRYLVGTMFFHLSGGVAFSLPALYTGGTVILMKSWSPEGFLDIIEKHRPSHIAAPPGEVREILARPRAREMDWTSVRTFTSGGDALTMDLLERFTAVTGLEILQNYGLTECEGFCTNPPYGKIKRGSIGLPTHGTRMRLIDAGGKDVPQGMTGEIVVQSKGLMAGYWGDPDNTAKAFINGWFRTGDLARQDEEGYFIFVGRVKNIIVKGGSPVTPVEVEEAIAAHPSVEACGVVGDPDPARGQVIHAFVVLKANPDAARTTPGELAAFVSTRLSPLKVPDRWTFVPELPRTTLDKIDRRQLAALSRSQGMTGDPCLNQYLGRDNLIS